MLGFVFIEIKILIYFAECLKSLDLLVIKVSKGVTLAQEFPSKEHCIAPLKKKLKTAQNKSNYCIVTKLQKY